MKPTLSKLGRAAKIVLFGSADLSAKKHPFLAKIGRAVHGLIQEAKLGPLLHEDAMAALQRMTEMNAELKKAVDEAYAFAVFPSTAKAALILGVTFGKGEVFEKRQVIGYAGLVQFTGGVQFGGQTVHALVIMKDQEALKRFKSVTPQSERIV